LASLRIVAKIKKKINHFYQQSTTFKSAKNTIISNHTPEQIV
jgi:hypothetical protein